MRGSVDFARFRRGFILNTWRTWQHQIHAYSRTEGHALNHSHFEIGFLHCFNFSRVHTFKNRNTNTFWRRKDEPNQEKERTDFRPSLTFRQFLKLSLTISTRTRITRDFMGLFQLFLDLVQLRSVWWILSKDLFPFFFIVFNWNFRISLKRSKDTKSEGTLF